MKYDIKKPDMTDKDMTGELYSVGTTAGRLFLGVYNGVALKVETDSRLPTVVYDFFGFALEEGISRGRRR